MLKVFERIEGRLQNNVSRFSMQYIQKLGQKYFAILLALFVIDEKLKFLIEMQKFCVFKSRKNLVEFKRI